MSEKKKRSRPPRPNARVRHMRAKKAKEDARKDREAASKSLGGGGIELIGSDLVRTKEDIALVKRAAIRQWMPKEIAAEAIPDKMLEIVQSDEQEGETRIKAAEACIKLQEANIRIEELELKRQEMKLKKKRLVLDKIKAGQAPFNLNITNSNQVANVPPANQLTAEQREHEIQQIESNIGSQTLDAAPPGRKEPIGANAEVAPPLDAAGGDGAGPVAAAPLVLRFD